MLTGDNGRTAQAIGRQVGIRHIVSDVLPNDKESVVRRLAEYGKTAMVGDGINDAPALTRADVGIAIGAGADVALDAADVVLMKSKLTDVSVAIRLSRQVLKNIHENLFWAFFYNCIGIPLAAGVLVPVLGLSLNPMFAAAAMSLSSFCVVTNALRLNLFRAGDPKRDKKRKAISLPDFIAEGDAGETEMRNQTESSEMSEKKETVRREKKNKLPEEREEKEMVKILDIEGMMCAHCQAHVQQALEKVEGASDVNVSLEQKQARVSLTGAVDDEKLINAVTEAGYTVVSCRTE
jgi:Cu2+-exporting ATPase